MIFSLKTVISKLNTTCFKQTFILCRVEFSIWYGQLFYILVNKEWSTCVFMNIFGVCIKYGIWCMQYHTVTFVAEVG